MKEDVMQEMTTEINLSDVAFIRKFSSVDDFNQSE